MDFCQKCGSVILIADGKAACVNCGYKPKGRVKIQASEKFEKSSGILVINEKELTTYPIVEIKCSKCKHDKAFFWQLQTRAGDESETKFYKCVKCEHTWRVYR
jgi:DNA-directed RNA polymerase subunit M